jgi:hypothetical protein
MKFKTEFLLVAGTLLFMQWFLMLSFIFSIANYFSNGQFLSIICAVIFIVFSLISFHLRVEYKSKFKNDVRKSHETLMELVYKKMNRGSRRKVARKMKVVSKKSL